MTASQDRIVAIKLALGTTPEQTVVPTQAQLAAGFFVAKAAINAMVGQLVPPWAMGMVNITDDEIHAVSDPVCQAVVNTPPGATP